MGPFLNAAQLLSELMKRLLLSTCLVATLAAGCFPKPERLTTTRIDVVHGTNRVSLVNPKDTSFDRAEIPTPYGPAIIQGYRSTGNEALIHSAEVQAQAQLQMFQRFGEKLESGLEKGFNRLATAHGYPDPGPARREVVILTNAPIVVLTNAPPSK